MHENSMKNWLVGRLLLTGCCCCATPSQQTSFVRMPIEFLQRLSPNHLSTRPVCHTPNLSLRPSCFGISGHRAMVMGAREEASTKGRDRGHKGEQRRDIRVFVGDSPGLTEGSRVVFTEDQARYIRECPARRHVISRHK